MWIANGIGIAGSRFGGDFDADAQAFFTRVTNAGGTLSTTEKDAVNQLVLDMKADGIWTKMKAIYPMVGGGIGTSLQRAAACAQNLKSSSFTGSFSSGWTFASAGVTPNGTSAYMDTNFVTHDDFTSTTNCSLGIYISVDLLENTSDIGAGENGTSGVNSTAIFSRFTVGPGGAMYGGICSDVVTPDNSNPNSIGLYVVSRNNSTQATRYKRGGTTLPINNTVSQNIGTNTSDSLYIGAYNEGGIAVRFASRQYQFSFMGDYLTQSEVDDFYTIVDSFNTTLSR